MSKNVIILKTVLLVWLISILFLLSCNPVKEEPQKLPQHIQTIETTGDLDISVGQMVYVPAYSQIQSSNYGDKDQMINFAVTLSIRNTDLQHPIIIKSVSYYDNDGTFLKEYVETPLKLSKMASISFNTKQSDKSGGVGANFIVKWGAEEEVYEPFIETVMLGTQGTHGFAWRSPSYVIKEINK